MMAAKTAIAEATSSVSRQGSVVRPRMRCGVAEPTVSAPTRMPSAIPRPSRNHVAMIFMAGGYAPAIAIPVTKRSTSAGTRLSTASATRALATAPSTALTAMRRRGGQMSGRWVTAAIRVPAMKPSCTARVRPALPAPASDHSRASAGSTAEALNQSDSASSSASDRSVSCRQRSAITARGTLFDDLALAHSRDLLRAQAEVLEDRLGVLAGERRRGAYGARGVRELDGHAELAHPAVRRMLDVDDHAAVVDLRIAHHLLDLVDLAHADIVLHQVLVPVVAIARADDRLDGLAGRRLFRVGGAHELIGLTGVLGEVGTADGLAEVLPEPRLGAANRQELVVARLVDGVVGIGATQESLAALGRHAVRE